MKNSEKIRLLGAFNAGNTVRFLVVGLLIANLALMVWYIFQGYQSNFHSDSAAKVLLAREIVGTGEYFPSDWNHVSGDLFVLFGHTFIIPFLAFFPAGFFVHSISGLISATLILTGTWFLTSLFKIDKLIRIAIVAIFAAGVSGFLAENLYGQVSYGTVFYFTCYIIYFSWKFLTASGPGKIAYSSGLFFVLLLAFWANPQRAGIFYGLPLLLAVAAYIKSNSINRTHTIQAPHAGYQLIAVIASASVAGTALHSVILLGVNNTLGAGHARWLSFDGIIRNVVLTLQGFLGIFGGLPSPDSLVVSISGVYEAIRFTSALTLLILIPLSLRFIFQQKHGSSQFVTSFALVAALSTLFVQFTTTVPDMSDPVQSSRYLIPSLLLLLIIVLAQTQESKKTFLTLGATIVGMVFITSAYAAMVRSDPAGVMSWGMKGQHHKYLKNLKDFLLTNGLRYGYATYWNAGALSVLSDEKVLVRQITIDDRGLPMPMRHLSSNRWYRPSAWSGETFLLLSLIEADAIKWDLLERYNAKPVRELNFEEFKIFVFDHNLAQDLPIWDRRYEKKATFLATKDSSTQIGRFFDTYDNNGSALIAEKGAVGALHFGPNADVEPGSYSVTFDVSVETAPGGAARIDVAATPNEQLLAEKVLIDSTSSRQLKITVGKLTSLEFRVWSLGNSRVVFRGVSIVSDAKNKNAP